MTGATIQRAHSEISTNQEVLGCVLHPARGKGDEMAQWVLKTNGNVVLRCSLQPLQVSELHSPSEVRKCETFDHLIKRRWGTLIGPPKEPIKTNNDENDGSGYEDDNIKPQLPSLDIEDSVDHNGWLLNHHPAYDRLLNAEVQLQLGEEYITGKIRRRALGPDRNIIRKYDNNPYLNSVMYKVEFIDGQVKEYEANIIAENMLSQVDSDGYSLVLMEGIVDYRKDESVAVSMEDKYITTKTSQQRLMKTMAGWDLQGQWKDNTELWTKLSVMKESHPVETAEFVMARGISDKPVFCWWGTIHP